MWLLLLFADDEEFKNFENEIFESSVAVLLIFALASKKTNGLLKSLIYDAR